MTTTKLTNIDLGAICDSGQCFRMARSNGGFLLYTQARRVLVTHQHGDEYAFDCDAGELTQVWLPYLDEGTDYDAIERSVDPDDPALTTAVRFSHGLRILRQDPWEALISFIISQRRSIASIRTCVDKLCARFGDKKQDAHGEYFAFPTPGQLAGAQEKDLLDCSVGYRAKYILSAARRFALKELSMDALLTMPDDKLRESLLSLYGVGEKVASCAMLFGFHRLDAFPVDVWVGRVENRYYGGHFPRESYQGTAGVMQQYLFHAVVHGVIEG